MYERCRRDIDKITFQTLAQQVRMNIAAYRKERKESILNITIKFLNRRGPEYTSIRIY